MSLVTQQLLDLQALDADIQRLGRQVEQLTAAIGDQMKAKAGDYAIKQAEDALRKAQSAQRDREYELNQLEARIKEHEQRLYSGKGSPRDLQALQDDIGRDKQRREDAEATALAAMEATERARGEVGRVRTAVQRVLGEASAGKERQTAERAEALRTLDSRRARREHLAESIPQAALDLYNRTKARVPGGNPVSTVTQSRCDGCSDTLPSGDVQRARHAMPPSQCPTCHRILHVP